MTTGAKQLGRMEPVDVRDVWTDEARDFTPWLAQAENLALLGETLGLELELDSQETHVGPFRADILCKETKSDQWVLIENQLERTNHGHLGQLLTYAAGLKAVSIVWIAQGFREEHRAALDWLNEITAEGVNFFGLEMELWRIGDSPVAPKFNVISQPNEWTKGGSGTQGGLTDSKLLQREYWSGLREVLLERNSVVRAPQPGPRPSMDFAIGRSNFWMYARVGKQEPLIEVGMIFNKSLAMRLFHLLFQERKAIDAEFGAALSWEDPAHRNRCRVLLRNLDADPGNRDDWPQQLVWIAEKLEAFHRVFAQRVREFDASEYEPLEESSEERPDE